MSSLDSAHPGFDDGKIANTSVTLAADLHTGPSVPVALSTMLDPPRLYRMRIDMVY